MAVELKERRSGSPGRRPMDGHVCAFHEEFQKNIEDKRTSTLNCLIAIKDRIKSLEEKMGGTISVKIAAIITTVAMGFLIAFIGAAFTLMGDLRDDLKGLNSLIIGLEHRTDSIQIEQIKIATKQDTQIRATDALKKKLDEK